VGRRREGGVRLETPRRLQLVTGLNDGLPVNWIDPRPEALTVTDGWVEDTTDFYCRHFTRPGGSI